MKKYAKYSFYTTETQNCSHQLVSDLQYNLYLCLNCLRFKKLPSERARLSRYHLTEDGITENAITSHHMCRPIIFIIIILIGCNRQ
jgi:hypothetical protein